MLGISKTASEDTIFLLDMSRSMFRKDLMGKSRIALALTSLKDIINRKHKKDANDRYSLIMFSDRTYEMEDYYWQYDKIKEFIYEEFELIGKTHLPIDRAAKSIIKEKRKIGQKIFRIIIISDGYIYPTVSNPIKFAKLAKDLGIIIDALRFGKSTISGNILKRITEITGGSYYYMQDQVEYEEIIQKLADKKRIQVSTLLDNKDEDSLDQMSKDIASPLLKIDELSEKQRSQTNFEELKCSICHSEKCMTCETGFFGCGRFCPNCLKPIHLHCAIKWAETQNKEKEIDDNHLVLRCPFCYYLLRIPITVQRTTVESKNQYKTNYIRKIKFSEDAGEIMMSICNHPDCGIMFDDTMDTFVYKCDACKSFFHTDCLVKEISKSGKCPHCGLTSEIVDQ